MKPIVRRSLVGVVALILVLGGVLTANLAGFSGHQQSLAAGSNVNWPRFGNSTDNTRFFPMKQINASNVHRLGLAWTMQEGKNLSIWETDPVVINGTMYLTTNTDQVIAVNAVTGKLKWKYTPAVNFYHAIAGGGGGVATNRGVAVANGKVYLLTFDDKLIALQAATGEKLWSSSVANSTAGYSETSPPTYWDGMLFVGSAESDAGMRGFVAAYNANTGKQIWRFWTVPAPGHGWMPAKGQHGGGDIWMPPTIDTKTGRLYVGTGNPSPDEVPSLRKGCNPWVDATVALNAKTGKFLWAHTEICPDAWDYDSMPPPMLFNVRRGGKTIRAVGHANKEGHFWIFNAATGKVLAESPDVVPETRPRPLPTAKGVKVCPGAIGGIEYTPAAYSPITHAVYQQGVNACMIYQLSPLSQTQAHRSGNFDFGGTITPVKPFFGTMSAISANTGKFLWHKKVSEPMVGGSLATAGNLVFAASDNGYLYAFNARNGNILWKGHVGLPTGAAPIAYAVNGTEYIALATGGSNVASLTGVKTGGMFAVFKLGGRTVRPFKAVSGAAVPTKGEMPSLKGLTRLGQWIYYSQKQQHVVIKVTAAQTANNSGFNFDGYAKGQANFVVPFGWNVEFEFSNKSRIPHSLAVAYGHQAKPKFPIFGLGPAETPNPMVGTGPGATQLVAFTAIPAGRFNLVCLVPGHIESGMWDNFTISKTAKKPMLLTSGKSKKK